MDAGRNRAGAIGRRSRRLVGQMPGGALVDAARSERLVAGLAVARHRHQRAGLCGLADLSRHRCGGDVARAASCVLGPAIAAISLGLVGPRRDRRTVRPQCALRLARQRLCGGPDGRLRLFPVEPLGVSRHLRARHPHHHRAVADIRRRDRPRAGPWRDRRATSGSGSDQRPASLAPAPAADLRRQRAAAAARQRRDAAA